eukprot:SAG11_NODE_101_length_16738_cov_8.254703_13_plen_69_part_00
MSNFKSGEAKLLADVVTIDPSAASYLNANSSEGDTAFDREQFKCGLYRQTAHALGYRFKGFGIEVYGS